MRIKEKTGEREIVEFESGNNSRDDVTTTTARGTTETASRSSTSIATRSSSVVHYPLDIITDDLITYIFTFLKPRSMGKLSMTCKQLKLVFESEQVQTEDTKFEVLWAKYAGGYKQPKVFSNYYHGQCILDNGKLFITEHFDQVLESIGLVGLDLRSVNGDIIHTTPPTGTIHTGRFVFNGNNKFLRILRTQFFFSHTIEIWGLSNEGTSLAKIKDIDMTLRDCGEVRFRSIAFDGKRIYYTKEDNSINALDPFSEDKDLKIQTIVKGTSFYFRDKLRIWENYLFFTEEMHTCITATTHRPQIMVWSKTTNTHIGTIQIPSNGVLRILAVEKIMGTVRLLAVTDNSCLSIFSIEDGRILLHENPIGDGRRIISVACSTISNHIVIGDDYNAINIWKLNSIGNRLQIVLKETVTTGDSKNELASLSNGHILTSSDSDSISQIKIW